MILEAVQQYLIDNGFPATGNELENDARGIIELGFGNDETGAGVSIHLTRNRLEVIVHDHAFDDDNTMIDLCDPTAFEKLTARLREIQRIVIGWHDDKIKALELDKANQKFSQISLGVQEHLREAGIKFTAIPCGADPNRGPYTYVHIHGLGCGLIIETTSIEILAGRNRSPNFVSFNYSNALTVLVDKIREVKNKNLGWPLMEKLP